MIAPVGLAEQSAPDELSWLLSNFRSQRLRTMREFAESEIVLPDGPFEGLKYKAHRQPYSGLWLDEVEKGIYRRVVSLGPTQSGKTFTCFIIPIMYHLFEVKETVIVGVPNMIIAADIMHDALDDAERIVLDTLGGNRKQQTTPSPKPIKVTKQKRKKK